MTQPGSYVLAARRGATPPPDWQQRLAAIPGVTVHGVTAKRAFFTATPEALDQAQAELSSWSYIEESAARDPQQ